ncbi:MAG: ATP-binding cassette domain-containing protein [Chlamydiales bacterium]|nr:ATP-binding cassette domain-containing protein [Chlamydiales bacterium]
MTTKRPILQVIDLYQHFLFSNKVTKAVDGVSLKIFEGETLGLVGESGCGKSTVAKSILRLIEPTSGQIIFDSKDITHLTQKALIPYRQNMQIIFQDTFASLNPRMTIEEIIIEPLLIYQKTTSKAEKLQKVKTLIEQVGLLPHQASYFPHELSGGQRQRVCIAKALALNPKLIICDESIAALDVSIQAQIVQLLKELQQEFKLTYLFISHDLTMVKYLCDTIAVMYLGKIVEVSSTEELCNNPKHPYTKALLSSIPIPDPDAPIRPLTIKGEMYQVHTTGCNFSNRCELASPLCRRKIPSLINIGDGHMVSCFKADAS